MSFIRAIKCDNCLIRVQPKFNGEHWLPPIGWVEIYNPDLAENTGQHLCPKCKPKMRTERVSSKKAAK